MPYILAMRYPFWSIEEVMEYLSIGSKATIYKLIRQGLPCGKIAKKLVFRQPDIDAWVEAQIVSKPKIKPAAKRSGAHR